MDKGLIFAKAKHLITQTPLLQILFFVLAKVCFSLMEMPHETKQSTYIPYLIVNIIFLGLALALKIARHRYEILRRFAHIQVECFLIWVINAIMMIFTWSLLDAIEWGFVQKVLVMICEILSLVNLTLLTKQTFITKMQFISYQIILALQIILVSIKTVGFIKHNAESPHKDIVLLNLTTQIALMIILMDYIQKSYRRWKDSQVEEHMHRMENQMVITNKPSEPLEDTFKAPKDSKLREPLELNF